MKLGQCGTGTILRYLTISVIKSIYKRSAISSYFPLFRHAISAATCDKERVYRTLFVGGNLASRRYAATWAARGQQGGLKSMTPCEGLKGSMFTLNQFHIIFDMYFINIYIYLFIVHIITYWKQHMFAVCMNF